MCVPRGVEGDECHPFSHKVGINVMSVIIIFQCYTHTRLSFFPVLRNSDCCQAG